MKNSVRQDRFLFFFFYSNISLESQPLTTVLENFLIPEKLDQTSRKSFVVTFFVGREDGLAHHTTRLEQLDENMKGPRGSLQQYEEGGEGSSLIMDVKDSSQAFLLDT